MPDAHAVQQGPAAAGVGPINATSAPAATSAASPAPAAAPRAPPAAAPAAPPAVATGTTSAPHGFDATMQFQRASNLPKADAIGGADPYLVVSVTAPGAPQALTWQSSVVRSCLNPEWGETLALSNLPSGSVVTINAWDKDNLKEDDLVGRAIFVFPPLQQDAVQQEQQQQLQQKQQGARQQQQQDAGQQQDMQQQQQQQQNDSSSKLLLRLALQTPAQLSARQSVAWRESEGGVLEVELTYTPSSSPGAPSTSGPVHYRQHLSLLTGALAGNWVGADAASFSTYKLYLHGIDQPYDPHHFLAKRIFIKPLLCSSTRAAHASLYSTHNPKHMREGWLHSACELFELLGCYSQGSERRYFTYVLSPDALRFSETGAAFFKDKLSKHALHANCEDAVFAGEFCVFPANDAPPSFDVCEHEEQEEVWQQQQQGQQARGPPEGQQHQQRKQLQEERKQEQQQQEGQQQPQAGRMALKLVIDNNSGSYSPPGEGLSSMRQLLLSNFPDMLVEVLDVTDSQDSSKLKWYHRQVPSRLTPAERQQKEEREQQHDQQAHKEGSSHGPGNCNSSPGNDSQPLGLSAMNAGGGVDRATDDGHMCKDSSSGAANTEKLPWQHAVSAPPTL